MKKVLILFLMITTLFANVNFEDIDLKNQKVFIQKGSYKVLKFKEIISNVKIKDDISINVSFKKIKGTPLQAIKIFAKEVGKTSLFITFDNGLIHQLECFVTKDLGTIIDLAEIISPNIIIEQTKGKVVFKGSITSIKHREKIIDLFVKVGLDKDKDIINLASIENPDKMIRVKLYVAEINNAQGKEIKNNWYQSYQNYTTSYSSGNTLYSDKSKLGGYTPEIAAAIEGAVTLTGGLTAAANILSNGFNVGLVLNYLQTKGVAKILDETNLITVENKEAKFHAGGTIYLKVQTTSSQGIPVTEIKPLKYGLELNIIAKEIVDNDFVNLEIVTKSTKIDWTRQVDGIPNFTDKSINTYVVAKNKSTIVLGGLINSSDAKSYEKIPLLGDIPILGRLFRSDAFTSGQSELVFFIIPEVVDPKTNSQEEELRNKKKSLKDIMRTNDKYTNTEDEENKSQKEPASSNKTQTNKKELSPHEQRIQELIN